MAFHQVQPVVPGYAFSDTGPEMIVHPSVLVDTTDTPIGTLSNPLAFSGGTAEQSGLTAGSLNAFLVPSTDVSLYKSFSLQIKGTWSGTISFKGSNDNSTFVPIAVQTVDAINASGTTVITTTTNNIFIGSILFRYLQVQMTLYTSGTATGVLELYTSSAPLSVIDSSVVQSGTWNVGVNSLPTAATGTKSNVASSASSVTVLASNASRKGAVIYNDSTQVLYLDLSGGTATNASYSVQLPSNSYFELPALYTGAITGIWAAANGNARVTEFS